jgi:serine kinase of HPr protein (carbohydrate metabolism regulator)
MNGIDVPENFRPIFEIRGMIDYRNLHNVALTDIEKEWLFMENLGLNEKRDDSLQGNKRALLQSYNIYECFF